jgi:hypothetical protein
LSTKTKVLLTLIVLMVFDILPIPVLGLLMLHVVLNRPAWFENLVHRLYHEGETAPEGSEAGD